MSAGVVYKVATETRVSVTAVTPDDDLQFPISANKTYLIRGCIAIRAGVACDLRFAFGVDGASIDQAAGHVQTERPMIANTAYFTQGQGEHGAITTTSLTSQTVRSITGTGNSSTYVNYWTVLSFCVLIKVGSTAGNFQFLWAQSTSSASEPAVVLEGSAIQYEELDSAAETVVAIKTANEDRDDPAAALTDDTDLVLTLAAGTPYLVEAVLIGWTQDTFAHGLYWHPNYSGVADTYHGVRLQGPVVSLGSWAENAGTQVVEIAPSTLGAGALFFGSFSDVSTYRGAAYYRGIIQTDTAGDFSIQWAKRDNGGADTPPVTLYAGSWMLVRQLNLCV